MENQVAQASIAVLLDPATSVYTKVVWLALRLNPGAGPAALETMTALSRHTVLKGMAKVAAGGLAAAGPRVKVPGALLQDRSVGAYAKVLYGLLQGTAGFKGRSGQFTYTTLCALSGLARKTIRRALAELQAAGWVEITQENQLQPIHFTLSSPDRKRCQAWLQAAEQRLRRAKFGGEAIMQEYLTLLIDSDQFTDNARPGYLVNPLTGQRLELDRYYPPAVAFEFHGAQHFQATERFTQTAVNEQRLRDLIKAGLCVYGGIDLVIVQADDLSLQGMTKKLARCPLPLRDLAGLEPIVDLLEGASMAYRANAGVAR